MKEEFAEFVKNSLRMGVKPPFRVVRYSARKGRIVFKDANGKTIVGKKILHKGFVRWNFEVVSC